MQRKLIYLGRTTAFVLIFCIIAHALNYILADDSNSYTRLSFHELYNGSENIDALFIGASLCNRGVNPYIVDDILHMNTFNAGSASQYYDGTYTMLVEAAKTNTLSTVFIELSHSVVPRSQDVEKWMTSKYIIYDYMKPSLNKAQFLLNTTDCENWIHFLFPARREEFSIRKCIDIVKKKQTDAYKNYTPIDNESEYYVGKGYVAYAQSVEEGSFGERSFYEPIAEKQMSDDTIKYLKKIIDFCARENIRLVFFCAPISNYRLASTGNYDAYIEQVREFLRPYGTEFYDFNLCKETVFPNLDSYYFNDNHLSGVGADIFTEVFARFFAGELETDIFYDSCEEKLRRMDKRIFGVNYLITRQEEGALLTLTPLTNGEHVKYKVSIVWEGEETVLQEYSQNNVINIQEGIFGTLVIEATLDFEKINRKEVLLE